MTSPWSAIPSSIENRKACHDKAKSCRFISTQDSQSTSRSLQTALLASHKSAPGTVRNGDAQTREATTQNYLINKGEDTPRSLAPPRPLRLLHRLRPRRVRMRMRMAARKPGRQTRMSSFPMPRDRPDVVLACRTHQSAQSTPQQLSQEWGGLTITARPNIFQPIRLPLLPLNHRPQILRAFIPTHHTRIVNFARIPPSRRPRPRTHTRRRAPAHTGETTTATTTRRPAETTSHGAEAAAHRACPGQIRGF